MNFKAWADGARIITCDVDADFNKDDAQAFFIDSHYLTITNKVEEDGHFIYTCETDFDIDPDCEYTVYEAHHSSCILRYRYIVKSAYFNEKYKYDGKLGCAYTKENTTFTLWAPTSQDACVELFDKETRIIQMHKEKGVFSVTVDGDLKDIKYRYLTRCGGKPREFADPYADALSPNGEYSCVVDAARFDGASGFINCKDPIIYELSIRDFTNDPDTAITCKSKYMGLTEHVKTNRGTNCGIDYLTELGITHVQIMPIQENGTVDDVNQARYYNWSYDPISYSVCEGSYSSNPFIPMQRITEVREMVKELHNNEIGVIYDVVYNHMYDGIYNALNKAVPYYYYRYEKGEMVNGSGCGNDMDTKLPMVRHLILNSIDIFIKRYKADGLRFDLMGLIDKETMKIIVDHARSIRGDFIIYGEGWDMKTSLANDEKTTVNNIDEKLKVGYFNDIFREKVSGKGGYLVGNPENVSDIFSCFTTLPLTDNAYKFNYPQQSINYVECHDGKTLFDRLNRKTKEVKNDMIRSCIALTLLSFGTPFIHSGLEFERTKFGEENSYNLDDRINRIDYKLKDANQWLVDYTKELIALRKELGIYGLSSKEIKDRVSCKVSYDTDLRIKINTVGINSEYDEILIIINPRDIDWEEKLHRKHILLFNDLGKQREELTKTFIKAHSIAVLGKKKCSTEE